MNKYRLKVLAGFLILGLTLTLNSAYGETHPYIFQTHAKMLDKYREPVDRAYGLINIVNDDNGEGRIEVMFSNGSNIDWVKFNVHVIFLNASGQVLKDEHIYRWLDAANEEGASERKVSKPLSVTDFNSVEVEFYLSDVPYTEDASSEGVDVVRAYSIIN